MNNRVVMSIGKIHTFPAIQNLNNHITRDEATAPNIDKDRMYLNREYVSTNGLSYNDVWKMKLREKEVEIGHPIKVRKNAVLAFEIITGFSHEMKDKVDLDAWAKGNVKWVEDTFGKGSIISATLHLDESSPHMHTIVIPFDKQGKLNAKSFTAGKVAMYNLQTSYGKAMEPYGLKRGRKKSKAKRKQLDNFYRALEDIESIKPPSIGSMESVEDYLTRVEKDMKTYALANLDLKEQLKREKLDRDEIITEKMAKYSEAIGLYKELEDRYDGDLRMVKSRINTYRKIEMAVPKKILQKLLEGILQKFDLFLSREFDELDEKKKKLLLKDYMEEESPIGFEVPEENIKEDDFKVDNTASDLFNIGQNDDNTEI